MGVRLKDLDVGIPLDVARSNLAGLLELEHQRLGVIDVSLQGNLLEIQNDVGGVFDDARNR